MSLWGSGPKESSLTKTARKISEMVDGLPPEHQRVASETITNIVNGVRNLGALPEALTGLLWDLMLTVIRKAMMPGSNADKIYAEIDKGLSENFKELVKRKVGT